MRKVSYPRRRRGQSFVQESFSRAKPLPPDRSPKINNGAFSIAEGSSPGSTPWVPDGWLASPEFVKAAPRAKLHLGRVEEFGLHNFQKSSLSYGSFWAIQNRLGVFDLSTTKANQLLLSLTGPSACETPNV